MRVLYVGKGGRDWLMRTISLSACLSVICVYAIDRLLPLWHRMNSLVLRRGPKGRINNVRISREVERSDREKRQLLFFCPVMCAFDLSSRCAARLIQLLTFWLRWPLNAGVVEDRERELRGVLGPLYGNHSISPCFMACSCRAKAVLLMGSREREKKVTLGNETPIPIIGEIKEKVEEMTRSWDFESRSKEGRKVPEATTTLSKRLERRRSEGRERRIRKPGTWFISILHWK